MTALIFFTCKMAEASFMADVSWWYMLLVAAFDVIAYHMSTLDW